MSSNVSTGCATSRRIGGLTLFVSSTLGLGPTKDTSDITIASRIGSIGGLVTCANSCLKYVNSGGRWSDSTASALSLPIEPTGSSPRAAIGAMSTRRSSCE